MRRLLLLVFLVFLGCKTVTPSVPFTESEELLRRTLDFYAALSLRDVRKVESMMAEDYVLNFVDPVAYGATMQTSWAFPAGIPRGRQPWLSEWLPKLQLDSPAGATVLHARVYDHIGITVSRYEWSGSLDGRRFASQGFVTDVWVLQDKAWILVMSNADVIPHYR